MELSQRESTAVGNMGAPLRASLSSSVVWAVVAVGCAREDSALGICVPKVVVPLTQN